MKLLSALLMLLTLPLFALGVTADEDSEQFVTFVKKLDKHVTWPKDRATEGNGKLFVVAVIGKSPITDRLKKINSEKTSNGKKFKIRTVTPDLLPANAHVLVVTTSDSQLLQSLARKLKGSGTLIVSHGKGLGQAGGMVNLYGENTDGKKRFRVEVNLDVVKAEGIKLDAKLLEGATIIANK